MNNNVLSTALGLILGVSSVGSYAATVSNENTLTINPGVLSGTGSAQIVVAGSWFAMDENYNYMIDSNEKNALSQGAVGLPIDAITYPGASHPGVPVVGDTNTIDAPFDFFGNTGSDYLTAVVSGSTSSGASAGGLNLSGWTMTWNGFLPISLGGGAWQPLNCSALGCSGHTFTNGNAEFIWDGVPGDTYTLNYAATVPAGDPSGFGGIRYYLHLEGVVEPIPVLLPAAGWLLASGLLGLAGFAMRRRRDAI